MNTVTKLQNKLRSMKKRKGFSLVELMIVIAVIAILFVVLVSRAGFATNKAKETGVKTDFRAFSTAAEQVLREHSGVSKANSIQNAAKYLNIYLDEAIKFDKNGVCQKEDPWNKAYQMQEVADSHAGYTAGNNGAIIFVSSGPDGDQLTDGDNYVQAIVWKDGSTHTATTGFTSNITEKYFVNTDITQGTAPTCDTLGTDDHIVVTYNKTAATAATGADAVETYNGR